MNRTVPRVRMFAGPNGSGKSSLKQYLTPELLGVYINPDEVESTIKKEGKLSPLNFGVHTTSEEILSFFTSSSFLCDHGFSDAAARLQFIGNNLIFDRVAVNSYLASVAADFIRHKLLNDHKSFTFETVMSHPGKVELLKKAKALGYRTYLYYIATDDPLINIGRIRNRVRLGGHAVPENKVVERYHRSLALLSLAIQNSNRAYIFDNSGENQAHTWLAEVTEGSVVEWKTDRIPRWFKAAVSDHIKPQL